MPASCSAYNCTNRWHKNSSITFYKFPKNEARRKIWIAALHRANWQPSISSKVCSQHFESHYFEERNNKRFLKFNAIPTIFDFSEHTRIKNKNLHSVKPFASSGGETTIFSETGEMRGCCVPMCKSNKKRDKISFHEMPSNEELREKWVESIMKNAPPKNVQWCPDQYDLVCAKHFTVDDYRPTCSVRCLKSSAVPSVFMDSPECEQMTDSSGHVKNGILELDLPEINQSRKSGSHGEKLTGPSALRSGSKNLKKFTEGQNHIEKSLLRNKKMKGNVKKKASSSGDLSAEAFTSPTPVITHLSTLASSRTAKDDSAGPADSMCTLVHHSPRLKRGISLLSNELVYNGQQILQKEIPQTSDFVTVPDMNNFRTKSSYKNFLMKELDLAQEEISELQACITRLKEHNAKLQWEKNSTLVTHLHDIKHDAVDGNYDAIILLNRIVHYSLQRN